jgi:Zn-dependent peptidase ImmA (M78 family)
MALRAEVASLPQENLGASVEAFLDELANEPPIAGLVPDFRRLRPDAAASEILDVTGASEPPVEVEDVCTALGVPLYWENFPNALSGLVLQISDGSYVIGVNANHPITRRRFSAAHECGHAVLRHAGSHYLDYAAEDAGEPPGYRYLDEREANAFAAALLMDERWLRQDFADGLRDLHALAERYQVSDAAMGFRLVNVGLS